MAGAGKVGPGLGHGSFAAAAGQNIGGVSHRVADDRAEGLENHGLPAETAS